MNVVLLAVGSRGDVQPLVALGLGLQAAGHQVCLATHPEFAPFVTGWGLGFRPVEGNPRAMIESEAGQAWLASGRNPIRFIRHFFELMEPVAGRFLVTVWEACQGAEAIIYSTLGVAGYYVAKALGIPALGAPLQPLHPTRAFPSVSFPDIKLGSWYNLLTHYLVLQLLWQPLRPLVERWRRETLGLPPTSFWGPLRPMQAEHHPVLYGFSQAVLPRPADWGPWLHVTGYWFLDAPPGWQPPAGLVEFLASGPPPVCVGFGSMQSRDPEAVTEIVLAALARARQRGILITGWGGLGQADLPPDVFKAEAIPHDWLFPRVAAVVHHGGAGTTAAGLRAGVPSILVPFFGDQPFWADRVRALGVGPAPVPRRALTVERLAQAIMMAVQDEGMRRRAAALGRQIRAENGVARAVTAFARQAPAAL
ncbi:MAG: glycosyltransferase [Chloroflexi bacterium]|nr:glycosyltransferase [Chloroflexota bacterium]MCI0644470.1 glycosyltransferase [Chloroflexota bacterium]